VTEIVETGEGVGAGELQQPVAFLPETAHFRRQGAGPAVHRAMIGEGEHFHRQAFFPFIGRPEIN
jgi:hypothetical protein